MPESRLSLVLACLATTACWSLWRAAPVNAHPAGHPGVIWEIGVTDNSGDEFTPGATSSLTYDVPRAKQKDWKSQQEADGSVYRIRFPLDRAPRDSSVFVMQGFFLTAGPRGLVLTVNGRRGFFLLPNEPGPTLDQRQANAMMYVRTSLRVPIDPALLHAGANEIAISLDGDSGTLFYDALRLEPAGGALDDPAPAVEPTIFYRLKNGRLTELTRVVVRHRLPLKGLAVALTLGGSTVTATGPASQGEFGDTVFELDAPALEAPLPYTLTLKSQAGERVFRGTFHPAKKWKLFVGLKIHNDIGFTDLPPHVEELDVRNVDALLGMLEKFPFYKFNFDTAWIADNYLHSRTPARGRQLLDLAKSNRIGINALYLNMLAGLCSGEEIYRALYFAKSLNHQYGVPMTFANLTDTPSQPWSLPSFLADAGIQGFALASNQHRGMLLQNSGLNESSPFYWEGPDGRRVIAWFSHTYHQLKTLRGDKGFEEMRRSIPQFLARFDRPDYPVDAVYVCGLAGDNQVIGDGGIPAFSQWNAAFAWPKLIAATDTDYYEYISHNFSGKLPVIRGDGGAYWTDAAGTAAAATALNRDTQRLLPLAEMFAGLATLFDPDQTYPAAELRDAWKDLLFFDEHSWGAHNSMTQPDRQFVRDQFALKQAHTVRAHDAANYLLTRGMNHVVQSISVEGPTLFVFNPDLSPHTGVVEAEFEPKRRLVDLATGRPVPMDVVFEHRDGWRKVRILAADVPGLGYKAYALRNEPAPVPSANVSQGASWEIESRFYRVSLDPETGAIVHLIDKQLNRDLVDQAAPHKLNQLVYAGGGEKQRIIRDMFPYTPTRLDVTGQTGARLIENVRTPLGQRIRIAARAKNVPLIESEITVYDDWKRVDISDHIRKEDIREKEAIYFAFPFRVSPPQFLYQVHNAWVRPNEDQLPGALREWFTTPNLVVSRDAGVTIALATPDLPLVTLTDINRGRWPRRLDLANGHVYSYVTNNYWSMNIKASQGGDISFRYSITSRRDLDYAALSRFDSETRPGLAPYPYFNRAKAGKKQLPASAASFLELEGSAGVQVTAFKQAEDGNGYILRLRETTGQGGAVRLKSPVFPIERAFLTDGVEENLGPLDVTPAGVPISLKSNRFSTVRLVFRSRGETTAKTAR